MDRVRKLWMGGLALLTIFTLSVGAQITGEIRGIVTDVSGAVVAGSTVTLTNRETGGRRSSTSDAEGRYAFALLKGGEYSVTVESEGFRTAMAHASVRSAEIAPVNVQLEVGQVTEQVVVSEVVNALDSQSAQVQESFQTKQVMEVPVGRNPNLIATTMAGILPPIGSLNSGSFFSNGNRGRSNNITIDNITATDIAVAGTGSSNNAPLNYSSIREVKIITHTFNAEFGRNAGSQVQYITKSGTNDFHGELYEYFKNDFLNARDWFDRTGKPSVMRYNQFGGVLGGPIIQNKTHFFGATEKIIQRGAGSTRIAQVPTAAMLSRVTDQTSKQLLDQYRLPSATSDMGSFGTVQQVAANSWDQYQYQIRLDHQFSEKDTIYGRFGAAQNEMASPGNIFVLSNLANFGLASEGAPVSANINQTHVFSPTLVNEFRSGFGRASSTYSFLTDAQLGPRISFANGQVDRFGHYEGGPQGRVQNTFQFGDTLNWTKGAHNIRFGGDFYRYQANSYLDADTRGNAIFLDWDDFAAGKPNAYQQRFGSTMRGHRTWLQSAFVQDDFRVTPTLTLNLGLRMEIFGALSEVNGLISNLAFDCREPMGIAGTGAFGCFTVGENASPTNTYAQPRIGFAWNPGRGKTVIRGGYGIVNDFNFLNPITNQRFLPPFIVTQSISGSDNFTDGNTWANLIAGTATMQQQGLSQMSVLPTNVLNYGSVTPAIDPSLRNPQVHQWSFGLQRELVDHLVLKASYIGTKANYLQRTRQVNLNANQPQPATSLADEQARVNEFKNSFNQLTGNAQKFSGRTDPRFNTIDYYDNSANSNFHALELMATRPFRSGYSVQAGYTWGKSIDDVSDALAMLPNDSSVIQNPNNTRENRGPSAFDVRHRVVVTHVWEIPFGSHLANPVARKLLSGWGMAGISSWRSGLPVSFEAGPRLGVQVIPVISNVGFVRPNVAGPFEFNPQPSGSSGAPQGYDDASSPTRISAYAAELGLSQPLLGNFGTLGRNTHRVNGRSDFDWNLYKTTAITERVNLQLRLEVYNVFNNHTFQDVQRNISNPGFGQYTSSAGNQRYVQLGAVLRF